MFWIGLIVGIIVGIPATMAICAKLIMIWGNMTVDEWSDCIDLVMEAGNNREATLSVWHDGETLRTVELEEK